MKQNEHILIKNIYYMLAYAYQALNQSNFDNVATEDFENIHNLFAAILGKGIGQQLKQGLYREYLNRSENLSSIRGKIEMAGTIRNKIAHRHVITCEYDELSENNLLNQIIKTTVFLLLQCDDVNGKNKGLLKKEMTFFSNVDKINPVSISWKSILFHRNNQTYRMLISICQLVIEGMLLTTNDGTHKIMHFIDDQLMCRLYEKFLLNYYNREFPQLKVHDAQIPWVLDDDTRNMLPIMQTDIMLSHNETVLIIDAKYYSRIVPQRQYRGGNLHSQNLYQIFTYVKNKEAELKDIPHNVSGMLLYAQTDETILPNYIYKMSGNKIAVKTLNLYCDFSEIKTQLNNIISDFFGIYN